MTELSPLAWAAIILIILVTVALNISLIFLLRGRNRAKDTSTQPRIRPATQTAQNINLALNTLRDPFREERKQLDELSGLMHGLRDAPAVDESTQKPLPPDADKA